MKPLDGDAIYALLPATVRSRDSRSGGALQELINVIAGQGAILDDNLAQLYDDLFIQTCAPWAIPYIGELIGYRPIRPIPPRDSTTRADVADTIGFRRRKGTLTVLDQIATDVTGWPALAVEFFQGLAVSQYVRNHRRPGNACVDVHDWQSAADFNSAFDAMARTADVRRIASGRGRYNIANIGVFVWRRSAFGGATLLTPSQPAAAVAMSTAARVGANRYTFDPFGADVPLINPPQPLREDFLLTQRANVPFPLRRFALFVELEALRAVAAHTLDSWPAQFFGVPPVLVVCEADGSAIDPLKICACNLANWTAPADPAIRVAVDPELGRLMFNGGPPDPVRVACAYAFSAPLGGGTYARSPDPGEGTSRPVASFAAADPAAWQAGVFEVADSGSFLGDLALTPGGSPLVLRAADDVRPIVLGQVTIDALPGHSVTLRGIGIRDGVVIRSGPGGGSSGSSSSSSSSSSSGSSASSSSSSSSSSSASSSSTSSSSASSSSASSASSLDHATVIDSAFTLILEHCSLRGPLLWSYEGGGFLTISNSLCSALQVDDRVTISLADSGVDGGGDTAPAICAADGAGPCGEVNISASTIVGTIAARESTLIESSLLTGRAIFERTQAGCVRYSYLPPGSATARRFRCQPDLAIDASIAAASKGVAPLSAAAQQALRDEASSRVSPAFVDRTPGAAGYLQLSDRGPPEIAAGAESGDEMGIFHSLYNGRRESNLEYRLGEYLRIGLEAGVIHAS